MVILGLFQCIRSIAAHGAFP